MQQSATTSRLRTALARAREKFQLFKDGNPAVGSWTLLIGFILFLYFQFRLQPYAIWIRIPLAGLTAAMTASLLLIVFGKLMSRYQRGKSLIPELILAVLFSAFLALDGAGLSALFWLTLVIILVLFFALKHRLYFYLSFSGLTLFVLVFVSFRVIDLEKTLLLTTYQYLWKSSQGLSLSHEIETGPNGLLRVRSESAPNLKMQIPDGMHLYDSDALQETEGPGVPILAITSAPEKLDRIPSAILYRIPEILGREEIRNRTELLLGNLRSDQIEDLQKEKEQSLFPPDFQIPMEGSFWTYVDRFEADRLRTGFFIFRSESAQGSATQPTYLLWIREPVEEGFPFHPRILELLRSIAWES